MLLHRADRLAHGLGAAVTSWPPYALIVAGLASLALAQTAYQTDAPLITLPVITVVMPLASLAVGIVALHETAHLNAARIVIMAACLAVAIAALAGLARAAAAVADASAQPGDRRPAERAEQVRRFRVSVAVAMMMSAAPIIPWPGVLPRASSGCCDRLIVGWAGSQQAPPH